MSSSSQGGLGMDEPHERAGEETVQDYEAAHNRGGRAGEAMMVYDAG